MLSAVLPFFAWVGISNTNGPPSPFFPCLILAETNENLRYDFLSISLDTLHEH